MTLQLRAWDNRGGTVLTWDAAVADPNVARGKSLLVLNYGLSGVDANNALRVPAANLAAAGLHSFGLYIIPEPSVIAIGALALGALLLRRRACH